MNKAELKQKIRLAIETLAEGWHVDLELNNNYAELSDSMINSLFNLSEQYAQQVKKETVNELYDIGRFEAFGNFCKAINEQNQKR